ncbi:hypothetical protein CN1A_31 [Clavibacter phage CN1A]|uniref:Uncharacterized protein n=1 Tax=Clavibacter phage CN1A TaxID=1406793 RepID=U5PT75_9CAUD|nr:hypothetical protein CN1A_31 [Clavibacter phage CN1A]AGY47140.1 hypothetical protein CN1A_31 [Clavibacter phage CN1A]
MTFSTAPSDPTGRDIPLSEPDASRDVVDFSAHKAWVGAAAAGVVAALGSFIIAVGDDVVSAGEWATIAVSLIVGAGLTGAGVYAAPRKAVSN